MMSPTSSATQRLRSFRVCPAATHPTSSVLSQQNQQLDSVGGCNAFIPRAFVVRGSCSILAAPAKTQNCVNFDAVFGFVAVLQTDNALADRHQCCPIKSRIDSTGCRARCL